MANIGGSNAVMVERLSGIWLAILLFVMVGCSSARQPTLYVGGIPDQDASILQARFEKLAVYLTEQLGINVEYVPSVNYAAVVTAFRHGDLHMAWYGGLTGVQDAWLFLIPKR